MLTQIAITILILVIDSFVWGLWYGGLWMYRIAFTTRLVQNYVAISIASLLPLAAASATYMLIACVQKVAWFAIHKCVEVLKMFTLMFRAIYMMLSLLLFVFNSNTYLLYTLSTAGHTLAYSLAPFVVVSWIIYISCALPNSVRSKYIALDTILGTLGSLAGSFISEYILLSEANVILGYIKTYIVISILSLIDIPLLLTLPKPMHRCGEVCRHAPESLKSFIHLDPFLAALAIALFAINIPESVVPTYIIHSLGGDESWIALINASNISAYIITPLLWSLILERMSLCSVAKIAIALSTTSTIVFPYIKALNIHLIRSFIFGCGSAGIWVSLMHYLTSDSIDDECYRVVQVAKAFIMWNIIPALAMGFGGLIATVFTSEHVFLFSSIGLLSIAILSMQKISMHCFGHRR